MYSLRITHTSRVFIEVLLFLIKEAPKKRLYQRHILNVNTILISL